MASPRTELTELATAAGLCWDPAEHDPRDLAGLDIPGIAESEWRPRLEPAMRARSGDRDVYLCALDNGLRFRQQVLGRPPRRVEWVGGSRATWVSDVPRDLTVDGVWFIQTKFDSRCVLNTSPSSLVEHLLAGSIERARDESWFEVVAHRELQAYYAEVRQGLERADRAQLPTSVGDLAPAGRTLLKGAMRERTETPPAEDEAYQELARTVSRRTRSKWQQAIEFATPAQRAHMLFRLLRIAGGPYWLLGANGSRPTRLAVTDTVAWRQRFALDRFQVDDAHRKQPQVDWTASVIDLECRDAPTRRVEGCCELRWSHGKLQGHPECKVQVTTPLDQIPGYSPLS